MELPFFLFMKHETEKEEIIERIVTEAQNGNYSFDIDLVDNFSEEELKEIEEEVSRRLK